MGTEKIPGSVNEREKRVQTGRKNCMQSLQYDLNPKKLRLIQAAEKCFSTHGYQQTSIRLIARAANTNSCMITYYFGSKEKLILEIIAFRAKTFKELISSHQVTLKTPMEVLVLVSEIYLRKVFSEVLFHLLVLQLLSSRNEKILSRGLYDLKQLNLRFITEQVDKGISLGMFSGETCAEDILKLIISTANQFLLDLSYYRWNEGFKGTDKKLLLPKLSKATSDLTKHLTAFTR